jgi:hypothetical protein
MRQAALRIASLWMRISPGGTIRRRKKRRLSKRRKGRSLKAGIMRRGSKTQNKILLIPSKRRTLLSFLNPTALATMAKSTWSTYL